jgi:hypothetical protein
MLPRPLTRTFLTLLFSGFLPSACLAASMSAPPTVQLTPGPSATALTANTPDSVASGLAFPATPWAFGAIQALRTDLNQREIIFQGVENPAHKNYGLAANYFLELGAQWYLIDFEDLAKYNQLTVGTTVNLHPSDWASCVQNGAEAPICYRMMHVYRGSQAIPPISGF